MFISCDVDSVGDIAPAMRPEEKMSLFHALTLTSSPERRSNQPAYWVPCSNRLGVDVWLVLDQRDVGLLVFP